MMYFMCYHCRRVFAGLVTLWNTKISSKLSQDVAVNIENHSGSQIVQLMKSNTITQLCVFLDCIKYPPSDLNRCLNDKFSMSLSNWSAISSKKSIPLNQWQKESIHLALKNPFQLIQGPPGMFILILLFQFVAMCPILKIRP